MATAVPQLLVRRLGLLVWLTRGPRAGVVLRTVLLALYLATAGVAWLALHWIAAVVVVLKLRRLIAVVVVQEAEDKA